MFYSKAISDFLAGDELFGNIVNKFSQFSSENADICRLSEIFAIYLLVSSSEKVIELIDKASIMEWTSSLMFEVL